MSRFDEVYATWRAQPFPPGSSDEAVDELHADLALADTWVAEAVIPFVQRGQYTPSTVDVVREVQRIRDRAARLSSSYPGPEPTAYVEYADLLIQVYAGFLARSPHAG